MPPSRTRFVTACQQLLALGVVLAALTPAASVVSLDVVRETPSGGPASTGASRLSADLAAYTKATLRPSKVPTQVVDPSVKEYSLTPPAGSLAGRRTTAARVQAGARPGSTELTSLPESVRGYGAVGVTWEHGVRVAEDAISLRVRSRTGDGWSGWTVLPYHDDHGPDAGSAEARHERPGTDPVLVGTVDQVQVQVVAPSGTLPPDMRMAVVDPGTAHRSAVEKPAIDTDSLDRAAPGALVGGSDVAADPTEGTGGSDAIALQAAAYTPQPKIYSRAQWGADEGMREKAALHYGEVHAGFIHHTVNANDYTRAEVPAIIRSIYAYHTRSRGWSDIGYNFLVDRFGRIWEGRYGGVDRPVVGAHTLNYNDWSFAMSAIGNYDVKQPSQAMVEAYGALFAWKLSLHGVDAASTKQWVGSRYFEAINGHRDAASTACPGRYLYAKIPRIRQLAAEAQRGWSGRELESNLASTAYPDLIVRRASDGQGFVIPTGGLTRFARARTAVSGWTSGDAAVASPDLTGDGVGDLVVTSADGTTSIRPGTGTGGFGDPIRPTGAFADHDLVTAVGDLDGDGHNDLVARRPSGRLDAYLGHGDGRFTIDSLGAVWGGYTALVGAGDVNGDGHPDLLARDADGKLWLHPGTGRPGFGARSQVPGAWKRYDEITGYGDFNRDGRSDLFVRNASTHDGYVVPAEGEGTFGHPLGPVTRTRGLARLVGAAQVAGDATPDLVGRSGDRLVVLRNAGTTETGTPVATGMDLATADLVLNAGDWDRDGHGDVITRNAETGALHVRLGDGTGQFGRPVRIATGFSGVGLLAAVGDMTGDGYPDLMGQPAGQDIRIYPGNGLDGLKTGYVAHSRIAAGRQIGVGRWDGDGAPDSMFREGSRLTLYPGNGPGGLTDPEGLRLDLSPYDWVVGVSDVNLGGHADVIVRARATGDLWLFQGTDRGFLPRRFLAGGMEQYDLAG